MTNGNTTDVAALRGMHKRLGAAVADAGAHQIGGLPATQSARLLNSVSGVRFSGIPRASPLIDYHCMD